jgi:hypothetical protein
MSQELNNYNNILRYIITEIKSTRVIVANRVNTSVMQMYWNIGKRLSEEGLEKGYGSRVVEQLSVDLKDEFSDAKGFSPRNLWDMKRFYEFYCISDVKVRQPVAVLPYNGKLRHAVAVLPYNFDIALPEHSVLRRERPRGCGNRFTGYTQTDW